jgi:hypothetical protein
MERLRRDLYPGVAGIGRQSVDGQRKSTVPTTARMRKYGAIWIIAETDSAHLPERGTLSAGTINNNVEKRKQRQHIPLKWKK